MEKERNSLRSEAYHIIFQTSWRQCYGMGVCSVMAASGTVSVVFININNRSSRDILSAQVQANTAKLIRLQFTVQVNREPK